MLDKFGKTSFPNVDAIGRFAHVSVPSNSTETQESERYVRPSQRGSAMETNDEIDPEEEANRMIRLFQTNGVVDDEKNDDLVDFTYGIYWSLLRPIQADCFVGEVCSTRVCDLYFCMVRDMATRLSPAERRAILSVHPSVEERRGGWLVSDPFLPLPMLEYRTALFRSQLKGDMMKSVPGDMQFSWVTPKCHSDVLIAVLAWHRLLAFVNHASPVRVSPTDNKTFSLFLRGVSEIFSGVQVTSPTWRLLIMSSSQMDERARTGESPSGAVQLSTELLRVAENVPCMAKVISKIREGNRETNLIRMMFAKFAREAGIKRCDAVSIFPERREKEAHLQQTVYSCYKAHRTYAAEGCSEMIDNGLCGWMKTVKVDGVPVKKVKSTGNDVKTPEGFSLQCRRCACSAMSLVLGDGEDYNDFFSPRKSDVPVHEKSINTAMQELGITSLAKPSFVTRVVTQAIKNHRSIEYTN